MDSLSGTIIRVYDNLNRLTSETTPQGTVSYTYDGAGRRTSMTVAGQPTANYTYDNANRLTQITQGASIVTFAYDVAGRRTSTTLPNGIAVSYTYDAASRVTAIDYKQEATVLGNLTYQYDANGNRTQIGGSWARTGLPQALTPAVYNAANQMTTFGGQSLTYDTNGNLTSDGSANFNWDARNRMVSMEGTGTNASFQYDSLGRRVNKTVNESSTSFLYNGQTPVQELSGSTPTANLLTGLGIDEYLTRTDLSGTRTLLTDALGSTLTLTDGVGAVQTQYTYEPFGKTTVIGQSSSNSFQYTGRENDGTEFYYYRARYYGPGAARFLSRDPIGFRGGPNFYSYVNNNPLSFIDPFGLDKSGGNPNLGDPFQPVPVRDNSSPPLNPSEPPLPPIILDSDNNVFYPDFSKPNPKQPWMPYVNSPKTGADRPVTPIRPPVPPPTPFVPPEILPFIVPVPGILNCGAAGQCGDQQN